MAELGSQELSREAMEGLYGSDMISGMRTKPKFWGWVLSFAALGVVVPAVLMLAYFGFHQQISSAAIILWPSSLMFMALDEPAPAPVSTVIVVYTVALIENALLYALIGVIAWLAAYCVYRFRRSNDQGLTN